MNQQIIKRYISGIEKAKHLLNEHKRLANRVYHTYGVVIPESSYPAKIESMRERLTALKSNHLESIA